MKLANTNWLITGGTSGLGLAVAMELKSRGAGRIAIVARGEARLLRVCEENGFVAIHADVSDKAHIYRIAAQATAALGRIDGLINNASSLGASPLKLLSDTDCEELEAALATNLVGAFRLTKAVSAQMLLRGSGMIVNITSDAAVQPYPKWGAYAVSKAALDHMTRIWAAEHAASGVKWLLVDPGDLDTPLHEAAVPDADRSLLNPPAQAARELVDWLTNSAPASGERRPL